MGTCVGLTSIFIGYSNFRKIENGSGKTCRLYKTLTFCNLCIALQSLTPTHKAQS